MRILDLIDLNYGDTLKQGDSTRLRFQLSARDYLLPDNEGKQARIVFHFNNSIVHEEYSTVQRGNVVEFSINEILPANVYVLEIHVDGQIFPSDDYIFKIKWSAAGIDHEITKSYGINNIIERVVDLVSAKFINLTKEKLGLGNVINVKQASEVEVSQARGSYPTLGQRLNEADNKQRQTATQLAETTAQLAKTVKKGEIGTSDLNKNQTQFDASWFSDQFLESLSNNEINTTFLEKGSVTTDKLADKAVELEKLGFVTVNRVNLANPDEFVNNSYISNTTGNVLSFNGEVLTGYIPVEKGKQYTATSDRNKAFYDKNKTFVSGIGGDKGKTFTSPVNGYVRLSFINTDRLQMVVEGSVLPTEKHEFSDYDVTITDENLISEITSLISGKVELKDNSVELNKLTPFTLKRTNLANPDEFVNNSYVSIGTGNVLSFDGEVLTGYIPVEKGKQYTATSDRNKAFYDKNKTFVSGIGGDKGKTFTSPVDGYVRLSFIASDTLQMVVEGGTVPTKYIPYDYKTVGFTDEHWKNSIKQALELTTTSLNGLKWNALGDSITAGAQSTASYIDYIAEDTGVIARNYGVSGNTIAHIPGHWAGDGMSIRYAEMDDDADIITVFGGTNDWGHGLVELGEWNDGTNTTLYGGTQTLIEGLINKYPTKKIGFILPIPRNDINSDNTLGDYVEVIKEVCDRYSIPTLDLYHESGIMPGLDAHRTALIPDGTHPNAEGHRIIANKIQTFLESL